jgi:hypothetical protein
MCQCRHPPKSKSDAQNITKQGRAWLRRARPPFCRDKLRQKPQTTKSMLCTNYEDVVLRYYGTSCAVGHVRACSRSSTMIQDACCTGTCTNGPDVSCMGDLAQSSAEGLLTKTPPLYQQSCCITVCSREQAPAQGCCSTWPLEGRAATSCLCRSPSSLLLALPQGCDALRQQYRTLCAWKQGSSGHAAPVEVPWLPSRRVALQLHVMSHTPKFTARPLNQSRQSQGPWSSLFVFAGFFYCLATCKY